jgi:hypothetical protein
MAATIMRMCMNMDAFRVVQDKERNLTPASSRGAVISGVCIALCVIMGLSETILFFSDDLRSTMSVARHNVTTLEQVNFNVSFPNFPCSTLVAQMLDPNSGQVFEEEQATLTYGPWHRLIGGTTTPMAAFTPDSDGHAERGEGCRMSGQFMIDKIPGNFIFAAVRDMHLLRDEATGQFVETDFVVHDLWFGAKLLSTHDIDRGLANALAGVSEVNQGPNAIFQFFLNIVPTEFVTAGGAIDRVGFQYTSTHNVVHADIAPGLYFRHQHAAMAVEWRPVHQTWSHFLTNLCAIIGGVVTVVGFAPSAMDWFAAKMEQPPAAAAN